MALVHTSVTKNPVRIMFRQEQLPRAGFLGLLDLYYAIGSLFDYSVFGLPRTLFNKLLYEIADRHLYHTQPTDFVKLNISELRDIVRKVDD